MSWRVPAAGPLLAPSRRLAVVAWLATLLLPTAAGQAAAQPRALPVLTEIEAVRALSQDGGALGYPVVLRGTVTHFDEVSKNSLIIHDGRLGQFVVDPADRSTVGAWNELRTGDVVEIHGRTARGGFAPNIEPAFVRKLGRAPLPSPRPISYAALLTGRHDCAFLEVTGVVQRAWLSSGTSGVRLLFTEVATEEGLVRATFWDYEPADLTRFIDARVRLRGNAGTIFGQTEQLRGVSLFAGRIREMQVLEAAPDPFQAPARQTRGIYNYSSAGEVNRRVRIRGVVTAVIPGHPVHVFDFTTTATFRYEVHAVYVKDDAGSIRIETERPQDVRPGQLVEAAGFPAVTPGRPMLRNAVFRVVGEQLEPAAVPVSGPVLTPDHDAELVRVEGELLSATGDQAERLLVLRHGTTVFSAALDATAAEGRHFDDLRPGSRIAVTGVYSYQDGPPPAFRLFLRSVGDVQVLVPARWWTLQHTGVMVTMLVLVVGLGAVGMRTQARRKSAEYQAVLSERTRVARELHDTLEQGLAGIALQLEAVGGSLDSSPGSARRSLEVARQMLRYSIEETRRSVMDLRSQALEFRDLSGALFSLARQMTMGTGVEASVRVTGTPRRLDAAHEHHLLRIGLEALTNALKHAAPSRIEIELRFDPNGVQLVVSDDGRGLGQAAGAVTGNQFGLQGVRERVDKLRGRLQIESEPGRGTKIAVVVPREGGSQANDHSQLPTPNPQVVLE